MISPTASPRKEKKIEGLSQQSIAPIVSQGSTVRNELTDSTETPHHTLPKPADRTHKCSFKKSLLTLQTTVLQPHTQLVEDTSGPETGASQRFLWNQPQPQPTNSPWLWPCVSPRKATSTPRRRVPHQATVQTKEARKSLLVVNSQLRGQTAINIYDGKFHYLKIRL